MELIIRQCDFNQDPPMVLLTGPLGIGVSIPIHDYERARQYLNLPELICPEQ